MRRGGIRGAVADFLDSIYNINIPPGGGASKRAASESGGTGIEVSGPHSGAAPPPQPGGKGKAAKLSPEEFALLSPMEKVCSANFRIQLPWQLQLVHCSNNR